MRSNRKREMQRGRHERRIPSAGDELNDGAEEEEGAVEGEAGGFPIRPQQPIQHLEPLSQIKREKVRGLSDISISNKNSPSFSSTRRRPEESGICSQGILRSWALVGIRWNLFLLEVEKVIKNQV